MKWYSALTGIGLLLNLVQQPVAAQPVLSPAPYKSYIDSFNTEDQELYPQYIRNKDSWTFLSRNIPLFDCPDKWLERTYYFRWWTYRKHIKEIPGGFVITEFLPPVPWAGPYNTINCAATHHIYEGSWLLDSRYITGYEQFWLSGGGDRRTYSFPLAHALLRQAQVSNDTAFLVAALPELVKNYTDWEKEKLDSNGLFWQVDGNDGMEESIGGSLNPDHAGYRATINAYMYADAQAIAAIAEMAGQPGLADSFHNKAATIKNKVQNLLWDDQLDFFTVTARNARLEKSTTRELHGYTPWLFNLPDSTFNKAWRFLMDPRYFFAPYGPTTAEQQDPQFAIAYTGHECQWNGPSWPFATSVTLTAMANLINHYNQTYISKSDFLKLMLVYANSHQRINSKGRRISWIDENLNPYTGDWISRTRLKSWQNGTWSAEKGGEERGKDYNHSSFCDLVITGIAGLRPALGNQVVINPLVPEGSWTYFCVDRIPYHGKMLTILYDQTGRHYKKGKGLRIFINGKIAASSPRLEKIVFNLH